MELNEKLDSNKMSAVQSFDMIVRSTLIDHEDRIKKIERAERVRMNDAQMVRDSMAYDRETDDLRATPTVERFMMWGNINTKDWDNSMIGLRGVTQRKCGEVVATKVTDEDSTFNRWDWQIRFVGEIEGMFLKDKDYQLLKRNGCFGEQIK